MGKRYAGQIYLSKVMWNEKLQSYMPKTVKKLLKRAGQREGEREGEE